jgi:UDP-2-acetamido-2-deoxy-ribo-hexuluronate aminotransferase
MQAMLKRLQSSKKMHDQIKLFQTDRTWKQISSEVIDLVNQSHSRGQAQNGDITRLLEKTLADKFNRAYCITTASCTDALNIALMALDFGPNAIVATSNYTFTATAHAIARSGYLVQPIDIDDNYCINVDQVDDVDAVVAVDVFGNMTDYQRLQQTGIPFIVDAAQSFDSKDQHDNWSAEHGIASCISFSPSKPISSWGSGGAILTDNSDFANKCRRLRLHGKLNNEDAAIHPGLNSMMSSAECAAVLVSLKYANQWRNRRQAIADYLIRESCYPTAIDQSLMQHTLSKLVFQSLNRDQTLENLRNLNVDCAVHYNRLIGDEYLYAAVPLPNSNYLKTVSFTVPNQHTLTDDEVERIAKGLK